MTSKNGMHDPVTMPVKLTAILLKCAGFWLTTNSAEQRRQNFALAYAVLMLSVGCCMLFIDLFHSLSDFNEAIYVACNIASITTCLYKIFILSLHRKEFISLIVYTRENFWHPYDDEYETSVVRQCSKICGFFIYVFQFFSICTVICYTLAPIFENRGKNSSDRVLPFKLYFDLPLAQTPFYEIAFVTELLMLCYVLVCYTCFDCALSIMNMHVTGQFRILQYRLKFLSDTKNRDEDSVHACRREDDTKQSTQAYKKLKDCIQQHQALIEFCRNIESVFSFFILVQMMVYSFLICLVGFQVLQPSSAPIRRAIFICHLSGTICQLVMLTYSCDRLIEQSGSVAEAAFTSPWHTMTLDITGRNIRNDIRFIIMRSRRTCCLTAGKFFPVSLETYTAVMSSAASYLTLLRQTSMERT